jgi:hypothetical protein
MSSNLQLKLWAHNGLLAAYRPKILSPAETYREKIKQHSPINTSRLFRVGNHYPAFEKFLETRQKQNKLPVKLLLIGVADMQEATSFLWVAHTFAERHKLKLNDVVSLSVVDLKEERDITFRTRADVRLQLEEDPQFLQNYLGITPRPTPIYTLFKTVSRRLPEKRWIIHITNAIHHWIARFYSVKLPRSITEMIQDTLKNPSTAFLNTDILKSGLEASHPQQFDVVGCNFVEQYLPKGGEQTLHKILDTLTVSDGLILNNKDCYLFSYPDSYVKKSLGIQEGLRRNSHVLD